uniref:ATP synthase F0 subunit 6 n=1 Tax=Sigara lateralis TaxID=537456 RepID=UPI00286B85BA|nr:ATP synthase F0 subunit 6 [Sigara lateralis]WKD80504.1 ATP synthase F0 subunit 6 [Sigara lateralis]
MMTNLFSAFDPATSQNMSLNWMSTIIGMMLLPMPYWMMSNRMNILFKNITMTLHMEFKLLMNMNSMGLTTLFVAMFMFILMNNMLGLLPYVFTSSSHMVFTLSLALPLWVSLMLFGWINKTQMMFAHLIPSGTPMMLMPFMVCIETISNIIRPGALAVRLMANMIAGHLLMTLLGNSSTGANLAVSIIIFIQMFLMLFETAVAMIQAYVFSVLSTLYTSEVI